MGKDNKVKDYDQFQLRLPPGMRERIKAKASRANMSMNEAIVWVLEREFPAEISFAHRIEELANLVSMLKDTENPNEGVENLIAAMDATLGEVYHGKLTMDRDFKSMVSDRLTQWEESKLEEYRETHESPFDDANWGSHGQNPSDDNLDDDLAEEGNN